MSLKIRLLYRAARIYWRLFQPTTIGVCALLVQNGREVLLVKHTYRPGWHFPGGGVKKGETLAQTARREAWEETGAQLETVTLFATYSSFVVKNDHVVIFLCEDFSLTGAGQSGGEIAAVQFFPLDDLPADIHPPHAAQIAAYRNGRS